MVTKREGSTMGNTRSTKLMKEESIGNNIINTIKASINQLTEDELREINDLVWDKLYNGNI